MQSRWTDAEAEAAVARHAEKGIGRDLALRVYTTRLLGGDPRLVLHGGGNTSVKTEARDTIGESVPVLCVKGSGWDMGTIEAPGLPALRLEPLRKALKLDKMSDEDMVAWQRNCLLDPAAPNPSVETLLHAGLPHKFVDHTHANAVLAISDQPEGEAICRSLYGDRLAILPYVMPGFDLARQIAREFPKTPKAEGIVLLRHGIFTMGETAREAYERMIEFVTMAERRLEQGKRRLVAAGGLPARLAGAAEIGPILRGAVAESIDDNEGTYRRQVMEFRTSPQILDYVGSGELVRLSRAGVATPDHVIRTKGAPLVVPAPDADQLEAFAQGVKQAVAAYAEDYRGYFARHNPRHGGAKKILDPRPRVILVPGVGLYGLGAGAKDAAIAADLAETTIEVAIAAESIGRFQPVGEADLFDVEYWSLEQAKLGKGGEKALARQVAVVTGAGSGIGAATAKALAAEGAEVVLLDRDADAAKTAAKACGGTALALGCDVTDRAQVERAFAQACARFGGVDLVVSNAGAAWQGRIGEVGDKALRDSFELNFFSHQSVAQAAVRVFKAQATGGNLLFNISKQAVNPGADFGPYGLPKAALLFLMRQYALDYGSLGIRANGVNADRIRTNIFAGGLLEQRAKARGMTVEQYMRDGNLLRREVTAADVARAFVQLALSPKTTGAILTVDGGNIAAALR
ncbi:MAG: bifunctional aldolase/short-chain dehydrogenase [Alphaproteobacteria bacterium]|nr:bifunctional aldolase/short-chain dehydrogenase [Alphaproteobacteria bacterium]